MAGLIPHVGGVPLSTVCSFSDLSYSTRWPYGDWEASWTMHLPAGFRHPAIRQGVEVRLMFGGKSLWTGDLDKPDWSTGQMVARGRIRKGEDWRALRWDETLGAWLPCWNPREAVADAVTLRGLDWRYRVDDLPDVVLSDQRNAEPVQILDLLDLARERGYGTPHMGPEGRIELRDDPTVAAWQVSPDVVDVGDSGGADRATHLYVMYTPPDIAAEWDSTVTYITGDKVRHDGFRWEASTTAPPGTEPAVGSVWNQLGSVEDWWVFEEAEDTRFRPYREQTIDARGLGVVTQPEAQTIAETALNEHLAPAYTTDIPATPLTVTGPQLQPVAPVLLRAGTLGRIHGANHPRLGRRYIDVIAGEVIVNDADTPAPTGVIKPYAKQPGTYMELLEESLTTARQAAAS